MNFTLAAVLAGKKTYAVASGDAAEFRGDGEALKSLTISIAPIQTGSGTPAMDNIRPISGRTGLIIHNGDADTAVSWAEAGTVYGGSLEAVGGTLRSDMALITLDGTEEWLMQGTHSYFYTALGEYGDVITDDAVCSHLPENPAIGASNTETGIRVYNRSAGSTRMAALIVRFDPTKAQTMEEFTAYLAAQYAAGTPVQVCYRVAATTEYSLEPTEVRAAVGVNRISSDAGPVKAEYRTDGQRSKLAWMMGVRR